VLIEEEGNYTKKNRRLNQKGKNPKHYPCHSLYAPILSTCTAHFLEALLDFAFFFGASSSSSSSSSASSTGAALFPAVRVLFLVPSAGGALSFLAAAFLGAAFAFAGASDFFAAAFLPVLALGASSFSSASSAAGSSAAGSSVAGAGSSWSAPSASSLASGSSSFFSSAFLPDFLVSLVFFAPDLGVGSPFSGSFLEPASFSYSPPFFSYSLAIFAPWNRVV